MRAGVLVATLGVTDGVEVRAGVVVAILGLTDGVEVRAGVVVAILGVTDGVEVRGGGLALFAVLDELEARTAEAVRKFGRTDGWV